jgi:PKHD-type hydroxylase
MMLILEDVLTPQRVAEVANELATARFEDGRVTAGYQSAVVKHNGQLAEDDPLAKRLGAEIIAALDRNLLFQSAALPDQIFPPLFNRYTGGEAFGTHVDNAFRPLRAGGRVRTDLSATLFLSPPDSYDGGALVIEDMAGDRAFKLPAGHMLLYPATTLHRVEPVTRGTRLASFFWVRSLVADAHRRSLLFDMDIAIQSLRQRMGDADPALVTLTGVYHNLLRGWAQG